MWGLRVHTPRGWEDGVTAHPACGGEAASSGGENPTGSFHSDAGTLPAAPLPGGNGGPGVLRLGPPDPSLAALVRGCGSHGKSSDGEGGRVRAI